MLLSEITLPGPLRDPVIPLSSVVSLAVDSLVETRRPPCQGGKQTVRQGLVGRILTHERLRFHVWALGFLALLVVFVLTE